MMCRLVAHVVAHPRRLAISLTLFVGAVMVAPIVAMVALAR